MAIPKVKLWRVTYADGRALDVLAPTKVLARLSAPYGRIRSVGLLRERCDYPVDGLGAASASYRRVTGSPSGSSVRCDATSIGNTGNGYRFCDAHRPGGAR